jgi:hypothetical protein
MPDFAAMGERRRVCVGGDLFHPRIPDGARYVGRPGPGLPGSPFANRFRLRLMLHRQHPLRPYLDAAIGEVTGADVSGKLYDIAAPATPAVATAAFRLWLNDRPGLMERARVDLAGYDLACWCKLPAEGEPDFCHARVLLDIANGSNDA